jgi:hypothetical protein
LCLQKCLSVDHARVGEKLKICPIHCSGPGHLRILARARTLNLEPEP